MAGDQNSLWLPGGATFSPPSPQPLHHCHSTAPFYGSPPIPGGGAALLQTGATALSSLGALPHEPLSESPYVLRDSSCDGGDSYSMEWGVPSYSASDLINGYLATSDVGPSPMLADLAGLSPFVDGALRCDSTADHLSSSFKSSSLPADTVGFALDPFDSAAGQFNGSLLSSSDAEAANFYPSNYQGTPSYSSSSTLTSSPAISSSRASVAAFCPSPKQESFYYSSLMPLIENPPVISGNEQTVTSIAVATAAGPSQAEPSERNGPKISLIWTPEEQRQLNELCRRYGHIECHVARLARIARPFHGKSIRDVALRIRWMEEKRNQRTKVVNSSRSHRAVRCFQVPGRSRDYSSNPLSSQPGIPY